MHRMHAVKLVPMNFYEDEGHLFHNNVSTSHPFVNLICPCDTNFLLLETQGSS